MRETIDLCGPWRFQPDPYDEGGKLGYPRADYDDARWRVANVPGVLDEAAPGLAALEGAGWYRRRVSVPEGWQGRYVALRFAGANYHAQVWVNGHLAGQHEDGFLPFELPLDGLLRAGAENVIAVRVDNVRQRGEVPGLERGWRPYGGLLREVELVARDPLRLSDVRVVAAPAAEGGQLALHVSVTNGRTVAAPARVEVTLTDAAGATRAVLTTAPTLLAAGEAVTFTLAGAVAGAQPWSPAQPTLYTASVTLHAEDQAVEETHLRVGFRCIEARGGQLFLNGAPLFLTGFNRHEDTPRCGPCPDIAQVREDLLAMRRAGANFVRLCHYPHHPAELDLCDELGLLAMDEIPLYWWNGEAEGAWHSARKLAAAKRQLATMISRDANHPALILWSVSNETEEARPEVAAGNAALVRLAQELDPTRLATHVSDKWRVHRHFDPDDMVCVNAYPFWRERGPRGNVSYDVRAAQREWREELAKMHVRYPDKPILVSEFGYPSLEGVFDSALGEEVKAQAIEAEFAGMDAPYVCGATIWCWADHPWPEEDFIRRLTTSPYGVVTRERRPKLAHEVARRIFTERQALLWPTRRARLR